MNLEPRVESLDTTSLEAGGLSNIYLYCAYVPSMDIMYAADRFLSRGANNHYVPSGNLIKVLYIDPSFYPQLKAGT